MLLGTDEITILRGSKFYGTWQWINSVTGEPEDFTGLTATVKIKNIHEDFEDVKNLYEVGVATVEPLDIDSNAYKGRVDVELSSEDTVKLGIPDSENDRYGESDFYSILTITLNTGEVILQAKVKVVESLESETLDFLLDEKDEAIIINGKLDTLLLRYDEYVSTRDNLIDIIIPAAVQTYNDNHLLKIDIYNLNHADKLQSINDLEVLVSQYKDVVLEDKLLVSQDKDAVNLMKQNVQDNTNDVATMKCAIEIMLDTFDDRFLGVFEADPLVDNDGESLLIGAIYFNSLDKELKFYNGTLWDSPVAAAQTYALQSSQSASEALASKNAAKVSEDNTKLSEQNVLNLSEGVANNYEPKNINIQEHISDNSNPHGLTAAQIDVYTKSESDTKYNLKININDLVNNLTSTFTDKPLSAAQGKVLKDLIDNLNTILTSNDTSLDELQEIVNFIKQNKSILNTLGISNIAGLEDILNSKVNASEIESLVNIDLKISNLLFDKPTIGALFIKASPSSIKIPAGLKLTVNTTSFKVASDYTLTLSSNLVGSSKTAGTDYYVYAKEDGSFYISASDSITTDRLIGGFHYGLVGETELLTGNKTEADMVKIRGINEYSFWDLKYRPVASPKGMVNIGKKWYDIYLLNSEHITNGTSKAGATIAAGTTEYGRAIPKIPLEFGGNNTLTYGKFTWFQASEIAKAASKQLLNYSEFPTIAYGVTEQVSSLTNSYETVMGKVEHYPNLTSKYGIEQATGTQWIWGNDLANGYGSTDFAWKTGLTDSRGNIYSTSNSPVAVILGGNRDVGVAAGSRASNWSNYAWYSYWNIGCRFACDHLELV